MDRLLSSIHAVNIEQSRKNDYTVRLKHNLKHRESDAVTLVDGFSFKLPHVRASPMRSKTSSSVTFFIFYNLKNRWLLFKAV